MIKRWRGNPLGLTPEIRARRKVVAKLRLKGKTQEQIAKELDIESSDVKQDIENLKRVFGPKARQKLKEARP